MATLYLIFAKTLQGSGRAGPGAEQKARGKKLPESKQDMEW